MALLGPAPYSEGLGAFVNLVTSIIGILGCIAVGYFVFRVAKWALFLVVPIMLYSSLVAGFWNGIASDFDVTRGEVIRYHYANAYALRHMSAHAFDLTCQDSQITLAGDAPPAGVEMLWKQFLPINSLHNDDARITLTADAKAICDTPPK